MDLFEWLEGILGFLAMVRCASPCLAHILPQVDYPYPADFLEPLPAWPVAAFCSALESGLASGRPLLQALAAASQIYYNYTGQATCLDLGEQATPALGDAGWDYQVWAPAPSSWALPLVA